MNIIGLTYVVVDKQHADAVCQIIDVAVPRVELKEKERKLCKVKTRVVLIVIRALGTITKGVVGHLESIAVNLDVAPIQKTALFGTAPIPQWVLDY